MECYTLETLGELRTKGRLDYQHLADCDKCFSLVIHTVESLVKLGFLHQDILSNIKGKVKEIRDNQRSLLGCDINQFYYKDSKENLSLSALLNKKIIDLVVSLESEYTLVIYRIIFDDGSEVKLYNNDYYVSFKQLGFSEKFGFELYNQWRENME